MQFAKHAENLAVGADDLSRSAGLEIGRVACLIDCVLQANYAEELLDHTLEQVKIHAFAAENDADLLALLRQIRSGVHMRIAHLEEA
ncbi:hypothetical protein SDC9_185641 [bioreactor metagenome]|uniref:Uncharacterized protein n=1 Tax=bioreactor metagenome TaxID=1076179 RepID=A0A645HGN6_9ZZZZ